MTNGTYDRPSMNRCKKCSNMYIALSSCYIQGVKMCPDCYDKIIIEEKNESNGRFDLEN